MSVSKLLQEAERWYQQADEQSRFSTVIETALALDKLYIPTRYPDALAELTPAEAFTKREGEAAMSASQEILQCVERRIYSIDIASET